VSHRFLAVCLWVIGALFAAIGTGTVADAVKARRLASAAWLLVTIAVLAAVLANAGADLW
jgi:hypothetical protein